MSAIDKADQMACKWLSIANELRESGKDDSEAMEKAQKYLDKMNRLLGNR